MSSDFAFDDYIITLERRLKNNNFLECTGRRQERNRLQLSRELRRCDLTKQRK
jgi:hypothetical protein